ncbi:MAG TPA: AarF/UbiB family protein [Polyangiaceae bacterium LLY-WYZ-15_(1-7)]|nr:ABC transporter [Sandaracinus sp.]HJL03482.1 AarF/UbiB family protein [Polyangiaceae bacterium LLY-WYZ-15_(1-7)]HJL09597.1 AarF/UbiB family protein [Polyangiaceae bacterium LLY-WYZ-15_(1-7)]HJL26625.1 AarF/UbiB family protein [Polyangiaceae bacterium LLY-WYZ-15_(1-7)]HJL30238.1 AarF/UbiB family protein [Polyangiaceae bacterium LLY-WYZ-15_(1-7)]
MLFVRLVRAVWVFGLIFNSYVFWLMVRKIFRRWRKDEQGRDVPRDPGWVHAYKSRIDRLNARRLLHGMLRLRGVYIKLGQVLSIMGGFLPRVYAKELESLQDAVPPRPFSELRPVFQETLGKAPEELYESIEEEPLAAASLGQVHRAVERGTGRELAVKVLYPGIRGVIRTDMRVVRLAIRAYELFVPVQGIERVHSSLVDLLKRETDYTHEAACMTRMAANFADEEDILFPEVVEGASSTDVLTMTFMEGFKITSFEAMEEAGVDREAVAKRLVQSFYKQLFVDRFFHADPHPGNFLVQAGPRADAPRIVVLDFGAISEVKQGMVDGMVDVLRGFFEGRDDLVLEGIEEIGFVAPDGDRALLEQTVKTYFQKLLKVERTAGAIMRATEEELGELADPEVQRNELRQLMRSVVYPEGWFYVERASVLMFWLVGQIAPDLDTLSVGFPYVLPLLAERTQKAAAEAAEAAKASDDARGEADVEASPPVAPA